MFDQYPKTRPPLPREIAEIYSLHYKANRLGRTAASSLSQRMEGWLHRRVAGDLGVGPRREIDTLEVGAGTLNQLQFEPVVGPYDIVEPFQALYQGSDLLPRVRQVFADISEVPSDLRYDRISSVATFEHICNLPEVVARCGLLLKPGGTLRVGIPSEGTPLWALGWRLTTGLEFRLKYGLDYGRLMRHEHVNTAREIREILEYFFEQLECRVFGLSRALSLYQFYAGGSPRASRCLEVVKSGLRRRLQS